MPMHPRRENRPGAGDYTGNLKAQDARTQAVDASEQQVKASFRRREAIREEETGVFDAQSGQRTGLVDGPDVMDGPGGSNVFDAIDRQFQRGSVAEDIDDEEDSRDYEPSMRRLDGLFEEEEILSGRETPEQLGEVLERRKIFKGRHETVHAAEVTIRVDQDVPDMTYGMRNGEPNNFNFKEGMIYKVPYEVFEHLNERGLVRQRLR